MRPDAYLTQLIFASVLIEPGQLTTLMSAAPTFTGPVLGPNLKVCFAFAILVASNSGAHVFNSCHVARRVHSVNRHASGLCNTMMLHTGTCQ